MPIVCFDAEFNETPHQTGLSPIVEVQFGTGDTRVQRVWVGGRGAVQFRVYAADAIPPGTIVPPNGIAAGSLPAVVLLFRDADSARQVLDFWRAQLDAPKGEFH